MKKLKPISKSPKSQETKKTEVMCLARARSREGPKPAANSIPQRVAASLTGILTDEDLADVAAVYREGLKATQRIWVEDATVDERGRRMGRWEHHPDYRVRKACADMIAAYKEGLPVQRQQVLIEKFESTGEKMERYRQSPEMMNVLKALSGLGMQLEVGGEVMKRDVTPVQD